MAELQSGPQASPSHGLQYGYHWEYRWAAARAFAAPYIYALLMSNRAVCRAYIVSIKTEPNLTVYSLHILLGRRPGGKKPDPVPFRASLLLVIVIVLLSLLRHPMQKTECKEFLQWPHPPGWQALLSLRPRVEFIMNMAFAYVLVYATPVTSA